MRIPDKKAIERHDWKIRYFKIQIAAGDADSSIVSYCDN